MIYTALWQFYMVHIYDAYREYKIDNTTIGTLLLSLYEDELEFLYKFIYGYKTDNISSKNGNFYYLIGLYYYHYREYGNTLKYFKKAKLYGCDSSLYYYEGIAKQGVDITSFIYVP